ncbi:uncharacterized protein LOC129918140 [Episyrphus balteatus]|uniref:uncharacterized protein LOC129918140 n=1 Tax=Episyrphus balteatus TaxID=286459 RepID=UPI00248563DE|nr:uncharacterized protein LOC129918140 [Episyrphus balteatus]
MFFGEFEQIKANYTVKHEYETCQHDKTASVEPFTLIAEVKKHQVLYNKQLTDYSSNPIKEKVWEQIHSVIFPNYEELSEETKGVIKKTVRKRWKSLRDALVKDHRLRCENTDYKRKKMSPMVEEMQFLLPYIQSPRIHSYSTDINHSPNFSHLLNGDTIDLTSQEDTEDSNDIMVRNEAFYPSVHLKTSEGDKEEVEWREELNSSTAEEYTNPETSPLNYTICEVQDSEMNEFKPAAFDEITITKIQKRKRSNSEEDLNSKLNELIDRYNDEYKDEDRMFLLSLLCDLKRVPSQKKLKVKSALVTALFEALN